MTAHKIPVGFIFNHSFFLGGGEHSLFLFIESLRNSTFEPVAMVPEKGEIFDRLTKAGIIVTLCPLGSVRRNPTHFIGDLRTLATAARDYGLKIIHANGSRAGLYGGIVGRWLHIPVIWHVRESIRDHFLYDGLLALLATRMVCVSQATATNRFQRIGFRLARKIDVIHNGADPAQFELSNDGRRMTRRALGIAEEETLISLIGNYIPLKGHPCLIKGFAEACKTDSGPNKLKLLCVGRILDSRYHRELITLIQSLSLESRVLLLDYTTDVRGLLSATDIFVLPSEREGFSRSLLEAMAMGLPVIASRIDAIEEAVGENEGAILVPYGHAADLAKAILTLSGQPALRARMGLKNRDRFLQRFTLDCHTKSFLKLYESLIPDDKTP